MRFNPALLKRLGNAIENLAIAFEDNQHHLAHKRKMLGLGAVVAGLPACAMGGLKYALPVVGCGLYQLFQARQNENKAYAVARLHQKLNPRYVPKMSLPRPRPF